jgi:hypothetical protein
MDCAICFEAITEISGFTQMSCKHKFHFRCLATWFSTQFVNKQAESCPCCRQEAGEYEVLPKREESAAHQSFEDLQFEEDRLGDDSLAEQNNGFASEFITTRLITNIVNELDQTVVGSSFRLITDRDMDNLQRIITLLREEERTEH